MSDMSQAQSQTGGDPLDLVNATGTEDDVMPGPANVDAGNDAGGEAGDDVSGRAMDMVNQDPAPEGGASLDPPGTEVTDPASGADPLNEAEVSGMQAPGGDLEAGADPMPDMSGTTPNSPRP